MKRMLLNLPCKSLKLEVEEAGLWPSSWETYVPFQSDSLPANTDLGSGCARYLDFCHPHERAGLGSLLTALVQPTQS